MATFRTHMAVGAIASSGLAAVVVGFNGIELQHAVGFGLAGVLGGILPDIDSDNSFAIDLVFNLLAVFLAVLFVYWYFDALSIWKLFGIGAGAFIFVRYGIRYLFEKLTVHRGIFHSVLAAIMMGLATTSISHYLLSLNELNAWLTGLFVSFGYIVHLILDEIYSVDFSNQRIKRSFGSAIKLISTDNPVSSAIAIAGTIALLFWFVPDSKPFTTVVLNSDSYQELIRLFAKVDQLPK